MPLKLSALAANVAEVTLDFGDAGSLTFAYRPALITERTFAALSVGVGGDLDGDLDGATPEQVTELLARLNEELARLLVRWDLTDDAGVVIPLTAEALSGVPLNARMQVLTALAKDARLGGENGEPSRPRSRSGRRSAATPTGSRR